MCTWVCLQRSYSEVSHSRILWDVLVWPLTNDYEWLLTREGLLSFRLFRKEKRSQLYVWPFHECMWASLNQWGTSLVQKLCHFHTGHGYNPNCCSLVLDIDLKCPLRECKCLLFICWFFLNGTVNVLSSVYDELELFGCLGQYKAKCPKWGHEPHYGHSCSSALYGLRQISQIYQIFG